MCMYVKIKEVQNKGFYIKQLMLGYECFRPVAVGQNVVSGNLQRSIGSDEPVSENNAFK